MEQRAVAENLKNRFEKFSTLNPKQSFDGSEKFVVALGYRTDKKKVVSNNCTYIPSDMF